MPTVCILAGGLGKRLGDRVETTPKPLLTVAGEPFLVHQLRELARFGVARVVLCVGYLGDRIESTLGPEQCGIEIAYSYDGPGLDGTLGAIRRARHLLGDRFLVLYGDTYLRVDYAAVVETWRASGLPAVMTVFRNEGRHDTSNVLFGDGRVLAYRKGSPDPEMHWIDYGLGGLEARALESVSANERDLAALYAVLADRGELFGFEVDDRFYEIGRPDTLAETERFLTDRA